LPPMAFPPHPEGCLGGTGGGKYSCLFPAVLVVVFAITTLLTFLVVASLVMFGRWQGVASLPANAEFRFSLFFTLGTTVLATILGVVTALPAAYVLQRFRFAGKVLAETVLEIPILLPPLVSGVALLIFFGPLLGRGMAALGLDIVFSPRGVVVAQWFVAFPMGIKVFREAFAAVDHRFEMVARTLGCSPGQAFFRVALPMARRSLASGVVVMWARTLGEFGAVAMLAGITMMRTETLASLIFMNISMGDINFAVATSIVMLFLAGLLLVAFKVLAGRKDSG